MARDDPKEPSLDIRNDHRPIHRKHHFPRGNAPLNLGSFTLGSQRLDTQKLMWPQAQNYPCTSGLACSRLRTLGAGRRTGGA